MKKMDSKVYQKVVDFTRELYHTPEKPIYLHEPLFIGRDREYVLDAIDSTFVSSIGKYVDRFEDMMGDITGGNRGVALMNGTAALHIALKLVGVQQDDEVICQPLTFIATANAISYERAIPHFVDVDEDTLSLSPDALLQRLKDVAIVRGEECYNKITGRRISACVPMHTFGHPARIEQIVEVCDSYHIPVIEDAAESLGSYRNNQHTGTFGLVGTFSFNGNKTVTSGGGGALITKDPALRERAKYITTTAKIPHRWEYRHSEIGYNYRMPNLNAALACAQLELLDQHVKNKRTTAAAYQDFFREIDGVNSIPEPSDSQSNYWLNAIRLPDRASRDAFLEFTNDAGVITRPIWTLMNHLTMFADCPAGDLSVAEVLESQVVNMPSSVRHA